MDVNIIVVGIISGVSLILGIKNWSKNKEITKDCILLKNEIHTLKEDVKRLEKSKNYNEEGDDIEEDEIIKISEGLYTADAKVELEVFLDFFEMNIDPMSIDAETLGGFIISSLGVLPKIGDEISLDNITIIVSDADDRKINKVSVKVS